MAPVVFPSHHGGFLGGEYGQADEPDAFAAKLAKSRRTVEPMHLSRPWDA